MPPQLQSLNEETLLPSSNSDSQECATDNVNQQEAFQDDTDTDTDNGHDNDNDNDNSPVASSVAPPRNVTLVLWYTWVAFTGRGLWNQNCLATLVFLLKDGDPKAIGFLTATMGMAQLCTSIPTGIVADQHRRDTLLKIGALVGIAAVGVSIRASLWPSYGVLLVALVLWGVHWGIVNTSIIALFSDSIPDGERSYYFTKRAVLINVANTCGPVIALIMFAVMGDNWTVQDCSKVLLAGNILSLPGLLLLCWMRDNHNHSNTSNDENESSSTNDLEEPLLPRDSTLEATRHRPSLVSTADTHRDETYDEERLGQALSSWFCCCCFRSILRNKRIVPSLVAAGDIISGFASGMSIRYIAIFLYDNLHMSPMAVQVVYLINPILQVFLRKKAQTLAKTYGRCKVTVALKWMGISMMLSMVILYQLRAPTIVVCCVLVIRTSFMNSPSSLTKSVLMDHVPREERAKWASLESVSMVSWSGSAALGGIMVDSHGILFNFCVTALLQFLATGPLVLLSLYDDKDDAEVVETHRETNGDANHENQVQEDEPRTIVALIDQRGEGADKRNAEDSIETEQN